MKTDDHYFMNEALKQASLALESEDVPIGCVIVYENRIIGTGRNQVEYSKNPTAHAEIIAINEAILQLGYKHLLNCKLYTTLEPCSMCAGAIVLARIPEIFIAAEDPKTGACGSVFNIVNDERLNHRCMINYGIMKDESMILLKKFFIKLRAEKQ
jgi:tRNA(adenine34) deaminase